MTETRDRAVEVAARVQMRLDGRAYPPPALRDRYLDSARAVLAAAVPVLFNDLADSIEAPGLATVIPHRAAAFIEAAGIVRAAAAGWGTDA